MVIKWIKAGFKMLLPLYSWTLYVT